MTPELLHKLDRTEDYHARMARNWDAKASMAEFAQNEDDVAKCARQRKSHLDAADAIRSAVKLLKTRSNSRTFVPPTIIDVIAFAKEHDDIKGRWPVPDIKSWWNHFQACGWVIGKNKRMKDWKSAALNGFKNWQEKNPKTNGNGNGKPADSDPKGWKEYLRGIGHDWIAYRYAAVYLQQDFRKGTD